MALAHLWVPVWPVNAVQEKQLRVKITATTIKNEIQKISCKKHTSAVGGFVGFAEGAFVGEGVGCRLSSKLCESQKLLQNKKYMKY